MKRSSLVQESSRSGTYTVTVDYTKPLSEMVEAGSYDYVNKNIRSDRFPFAGEGRVKTEIILIRFRHIISGEDSLTEMEKLGLRPAVLPELLALGGTHPALQKEFPIVGLGSIWHDDQGYRDVPYLSHWRLKRELRLRYFMGKWDDFVRFAVVHK